MDGLREVVGNIQEVKNIEIKGIVDVKNNPMNVDEWTNLFIKWIEENDWTFGGITSECNDQ